MKKEFTSANILEAHVECTGPCGGDAGHGGYVSLIFKNIASTSMYLNDLEIDEFKITFRGDSEMSTLLAALKMFVKQIELTGVKDDVYF